MPRRNREAVMFDFLGEAGRVPLRYPHRAVEQIEDEAGMGFYELLASNRASTTLGLLVWAGIRHGGKYGPKFSRDQAGEVIDDFNAEGGDVRDLLKAVGEGLVNGGVIDRNRFDPDVVAEIEREREEARAARAREREGGADTPPEAPDPTPATT